MLPGVNQISDALNHEPGKKIRSKDKTENPELFALMLNGAEPKKEEVYEFNVDIEKDGALKVTVTEKDSQTHADSQKNTDLNRDQSDAEGKDRISQEKDPKKDKHKIDYSQLNQAPERKKISEKKAGGLEQLQDLRILQAKTDKTDLKKGDDGISKTRIIRMDELDIKTRQQAQEIIRDIRSGKISEEKGKLALAELISNTKKADEMKTDLAKDKKSRSMEMSHEPVLILSDKEMVKGSDKIKPLDGDEIKTDKLNDRQAQAKQAERKDLPQKTGKDLEQTEFKNEIKLDIGDLRLNSASPADKKEAMKTALTENREKIFEALSKNTKIIMMNDETRFSTMIRPEGFGRVDLKFTVRDGKIDGRMIVQNQEALDFFRNNIEEMRAVFQKANVELGKFDISLAGGNLMQNQDGFSRNTGGFQDNQSEMMSFTMNHSKEKVFDDNNVFGNGSYTENQYSSVNLFI